MLATRAAGNLPVIGGTAVTALAEDVGVARTLAGLTVTVASVAVTAQDVTHAHCDRDKTLHNINL